MFSILQNLIDKFSKKTKSCQLKSKQEKIIPNNHKSVKTKKVAGSPVKQKNNMVSMKIPKQIKKNVNKHGLPVFDKHTDFSQYFKDQQQPAVKSAKNSSIRKLNSEKPKKRKQKPVNKHGIAILKKNDDFSQYFKDQHKKNPCQNNMPEENFEEMLEKSLSGKSMAELLKEKTDNHINQPILTTKEKIKNYPLPQEVIDLHGCTGAEAVAQTETFIKNAQYKGKRTLLIIVGKGLHTEGKPVLPDVVEAKLLDLKRQKQILDFEWEKGVKRKSGSLIVYIKNSF